MLQTTVIFICRRYMAEILPIRRKLYPINQSTIFIRGANVQKQIAGSLGRYIVRNWHLALLCITIYSGERIFMVKGDPRNPQT